MSKVLALVYTLLTIILNKIKQSEIGNTILLHLANLGLKELYSVIPSLPVSAEYKNEVTSMQNPFVIHQHGKSERTVDSEETDGN